MLALEDSEEQHCLQDGRYEILDDGKDVLPLRALWHNDIVTSLQWNVSIRAVSMQNVMNVYLDFEDATVFLLSQDSYVLYVEVIFLSKRLS